MAHLPARREITILVLFTACDRVEAQRKWKFEKYPGYFEVYEHLYSKYRVGCEGCVVKLAKDPKGWSVRYTKNDVQVEEHELWSFKGNKYVKADLPELKKGEQRSKEQKGENTPWTAGYYNACPYYGYRGWFQDVINEYGEIPGLPARTMYGVARAYSAASRCRLGDFVLECPEGFCYLDSSLTDRLTTQERKDHQILCVQAIDAFGRLASRDRDFQTHVGEATLKHSHEPVTVYVDLLIAGEDEKAARTWLRPDQYEPFYIANAKNYLASCDSNAVLFTNGDSDSYPLWYVQAVLGYRTDVLVTNASLLNLPRYVDRVRQGHLDANPLRLDLSPTDYAAQGSDVVIIDGTSSDTIAVKDLLMEIRTKIGRDPKALITVEYRYVRVDLQEGKAIVWKLPRYLLRSGITMLDIIANHASERPIQWAVTVAPDIYIGTSEHLVNRLSPMDAGVKISDASRVNMERSSDLFLNRFDWSGLERTTPNKMRMVTNYRLQMADAAEACLQRGDTTSATRILDRCVELFPDSVWTYDRIMLRVLENYYAAGKPDAADRVSLLVAHNLKTIPEERTWLEAPSPDEERILQAVIDRLRTKATEHGRQHVIEALDALPKGWPEPNKEH